MAPSQKPRAWLDLRQDENVPGKNRASRVRQTVDVLHAASVRCVSKGRSARQTQDPDTRCRALSALGKLGVRMIGSLCSCTWTVEVTGIMLEAFNPSVQLNAWPSATQRWRLQLPRHTLQTFATTGRWTGNGGKAHNDWLD